MEGHYGTLSHPGRHLCWIDYRVLKGLGQLSINNVSLSIIIISTSYFSVLHMPSMTLGTCNSEDQQGNQDRNQSRGNLIREVITQLMGKLHRKW